MTNEPFDYDTATDGHTTEEPNLDEMTRALNKAIFKAARGDLGVRLPARFDKRLAEELLAAGFCLCTEGQAVINGEVVRLDSDVDGWLKNGGDLYRVVREGEQ